MKEINSNTSWEEVILKVITKCGGKATLKELYQFVPKIRKTTPHSDTNHIIRAYLRRMTRISGKLKRVGFGLYALPDVKIEGNLLEDIQKGKSEKEVFKGISENKLHSYVEGLLIELGNIYGYLTYTADPSGIFNDKPLRKLTSVDEFPQFSSPALLKIIRTIDVIWFKKQSMIVMPKHTFDVEITTDFSKALHRAYQLRDFRTTFYVVAPKEKRELFQNKLATDPYIEINKRFFFRSLHEIFSLYEESVKHFYLKDRIIVEP